MDIRVASNILRVHVLSSVTRIALQRYPYQRTAIIGGMNERMSSTGLKVKSNAEMACHCETKVLPRKKKIAPTITMPMIRCLFIYLLNFCNYMPCGHLIDPRGKYKIIGTELLLSKVLKQCSSK